MKILNLGAGSTRPITGLDYSSILGQTEHDLKV